MKSPRSLSFASLPAMALLAGLIVGTTFLTPDVLAAQGGPSSHQQSGTASLDVMVDKSVPLQFKKPASSVFIANPLIADIQVNSPLSVTVYGKKVGDTSLQISDENGRVILIRTIHVKQNLDDLRTTLRMAIPDSDIQVESIPDGLVLSGTVKDPTAVEDARRLARRYITSEGDIINHLQIKANNQVEIRVRFAEVAREVDKRFGINWENSASIGSFMLGVAHGSDFINPDTTETWTRTTLDGESQDAIAGSFNNGHFSVNGMIDALAKNGLVTILAEPSLTAMSGQTASFLAGGEFPIPVPQDGGSITIEWKQYGVSLAFTPTILSGDRINLHVRPEVSQLSDAGSITLDNVAIPALTTRRAETTLELASGQSFAIAGLLNNQQTQSVSKFPFLGDVPILGPLFRSTRFQNSETELVIIITPYVVKPSTANKLALPTDGRTTPSDTDLFFKMRETSSDPNAKPISGEPVAAKVDAPIYDMAPAPAKAPVPVVTSGNNMVPPPALPAPVNVKPSALAEPKTVHRFQTPEEIAARPDPETVAQEKPAKKHAAPVAKSVINTAAPQKAAESPKAETPKEEALPATVEKPIEAKPEAQKEEVAPKQEPKAQEPTAQSLPAPPKAKEAPAQSKSIQTQAPASDSFQPALAGPGGFIVE